MVAGVSSTHGTHEKLTKIWKAGLANSGQNKVYVQYNRTTIVLRSVPFLCNLSVLRLLTQQLSLLRTDMGQMPAHSQGLLIMHNKPFEGCASSKKFRLGGRGFGSDRSRCRCISGSMKAVDIEQRPAGREIQGLKCFYYASIL